MDEALLLETMPVALRLAQRYRAVLDPDDLHQLVALGVLVAARRFDATRGASFQTFAAHHALGAVRHYVRDLALPIRGPRGTDWPRVDGLQREVAAQDDGAADRLTVREALARLPHRERAAVFFAFYADTSQTETARHLRCSQKHVSRLLHRALRRLRAIFDAGKGSDE